MDDDTPGITNKTLSLFDLSGKTAVLTGATGRLGQEIAFALMDLGANVVLVARNAERLGHLEDKLKARHTGRVLIAPCNLQEAETVPKLFGRVQQEFGGLDILVNGMTANLLTPVETLNAEGWDTTMHGAVGTAFLCCQAAGRIMKARRGGSIINISSIYGVVAADQRIYGDSGFNSSVVYATAKGALLQMTRYLAAYWASAGIRVNAITPGGVEDTANQHPEFRANYEGRTPMQRMMRRDEIRGAVAYLASGASSYVTGHNLVLDGGFTII